MDLDAEVERLRLDLLAHQVSTALAAAGVPHALLKGPTTAEWLYDPPRPYRDVDVLVPAARITDAVATLAAADVARADSGRFGEQAEHSQLLHAPTGHEVDLHTGLPAAPARGDRTWTVLGAGLLSFELRGVGPVPALDLPARLVVLALHALGSGPAETVPAEDLRRAWAALGDPARWAAAGLARDLELDALFRAGLRSAGIAERTPGGGPGRDAVRAALLLAGPSASARGAQRLLELAPRERLGAAWREVLPSRGFMAGVDPAAATGARGLALAHLRRWRRIVPTLPRAAREVLAARRAARAGSSAGGRVTPERQQGGDDGLRLAADQLDAPGRGDHRGGGGQAPRRP